MAAAPPSDCRIDAADPPPPDTPDTPERARPRAAPRRPRRPPPVREELAFLRPALPWEAALTNKTTLAATTSLFLGSAFLPRRLAAGLPSPQVLILWSCIFGLGWKFMDAGDFDEGACFVNSWSIGYLAAHSKTYLKSPKPAPVLLAAAAAANIAAFGRIGVKHAYEYLF